MLLEGIGSQTFVVTDEIFRDAGATRLIDRTPFGGSWRTRLRC
jgi:hypothetical protein